MVSIGIAYRYFILPNGDGIIIERGNFFYIDNVGFTDTCKNMLWQLLVDGFHVHRCHNSLLVRLHHYVILQSFDEQDIFKMYFNELPFGFDEKIIVTIVLYFSCGNLTL